MLFSTNNLLEMSNKERRKLGIQQILMGVCIIISGISIIGIGVIGAITELPLYMLLR